MKKTYVLDTNVLLHDARALEHFEDNDIYLPITVIEEMDRFKKGLNGLGRSARYFSRTLDRLRQESGLSGGGIPIGSNGGQLHFVTGQGEPRRLPYGFDSEGSDNRILSLLLEVRERVTDMPVILVSRDTNMRIKANALGITAEDYEHDRIQVEELYSGLRHLDVEGRHVDALHAGDPVDLPELELVPFEFILLRNQANPQQTGLGMMDPDQGRVILVEDRKPLAWGIKPRNLEQLCAMQLLLDDRVKLVTLAGMAGTGKTLLAVACGLQKVSEDQIYHRLLISRPIFPMGKDIGFLPGDLQDKLDPWMKPIYDNLELLLGPGSSGGRSGGGYRLLIEDGTIEVEPLTYIRGRSIPHQFLIVDEAQNLNPHEIKTILTRAGEGTKVVLTGDLQQIDNAFLDSTSNGLSYCIQRLRGEPLVAHVTLKKGERSPLAELAARRL